MSGAIRMDSLITTAARRSRRVIPGALNRVALRDDAGAALRGIAMAQLGDLARAKVLCAGRAFGPKEAVAAPGVSSPRPDRARLARPKLAGEPPDAARATLEAHGDRVNAAHARYLAVRRLLLIGRLDEAERTLAELDPTPSRPPCGPPMRWWS